MVSIVILGGLIAVIFKGVMYALHYHSRDAFLLLKLVFFFRASVGVGFVRLSETGGALRWRYRIALASRLIKSDLYAFPEARYC